jgi:hypothetical protein
LVPRFVERKDISVRARRANTISENFPVLGAHCARWLPRDDKVLHAVLPARRPVRAAILGSLPGLQARTLKLSAGPWRVSGR